MSKNIKYETIVNMFTVEDGYLKILLERKNVDPYKGYWRLPNKELEESKTLEENMDEQLKEIIDTTEIYKEQCHTFSEINRCPNDRKIGTSFIALIDNKVIEIKKEKTKNKDIGWFNIKELPKIAYDHKEIIKTSLQLLKTKLTDIAILKNLFPSDFTLPELQNIYESIMNIKLDRRNFRKKIINLGIIEDTGYKNIGGSGRPAKLYRFKEINEEI